MLPGSLLTEYTDRFFGFGTWSARIWFIGIEEAGGWSEKDVRKRLEAWEQNGKRDLENAPTFYPASGNSRWHGKGAERQETWEQLVRMLLVARGLTDTDDAILDYQRSQLGRTGGETCVAELLPLPSPSIKTWRYSNWSDLRWLSCRDYYYAHLLVARAGQLAQRIRAALPPIVIFYGTSFFRTWSAVAGATWKQAIPDKLVTFNNGNTMFFVTKHPVDPALGNGRNAYFREIGEYLRRENADVFTAVGVGATKTGVAKRKATVPVMPARLDWPSMIGNFLLNFGTLDWVLFVFLQDHLSPDEFAEVQKWHFKDLVARIAQYLRDTGYPPVQQAAFVGLVERLEPIRKFRNHIAHGLMHASFDANTKKFSVALFKAKDLDSSDLPDSKPVEFDELLDASDALAALSNEFLSLAGFKTDEDSTTANL
jgi:hypothetical protein